MLLHQWQKDDVVDLDPVNVLEVAVGIVTVADVGVARAIQCQRGLLSHIAIVVHGLDVPA
ncbi:MAG: hypothetical protein AB8I69_20970 [Anaerolineae bacterium]|jgi:hypothetical protein